MQDTWFQSLGWEDPLEKEMATHSSILAWRIPWTEEPGSQSPWGHKESDMTKQHTHTHAHHYSGLTYVQKKTCPNLTPPTCDETLFGSVVCGHETKDLDLKSSWMYGGI